MHYFDNAATTFPKPETVYETMDKFYRTYGVNAGRGMFREASVANNLISETRQLMLDLLHATSDYDCIFTSSATEALNVILQGMSWSEGMVVYTTPFEHNAILRTLKYLENEHGIVIKELTPKNFIYDISEIKQNFSQNIPNVVVMSHASNAFGFINPIKEIFNLAKEFGATTVCDMAQTAGLIDTDIVENKIDYAVFAGHKTLYGPFGIAGFVTNTKCKLKPLIYGGTGIDSKNLHMPEETPTKYEAGSHNICAIAGLNAALKWINETGINNVFDKEKDNTIRLLKIIEKHKNISVVRCADESKNIGVVSCVFEGYSSDNIGQVLSEQNIATRTGLHCSPRSHTFMNTAPNGTVRFAISYFTSNEDFAALEQSLDYIEMEG